MWKKYFLPVMIVVCALSVSSAAAFFSVYGLSKLFAGASLAVIIMASSLEVSKLVIVSLLYQYRERLPVLLKTYLYTATVILIVITSAGIYGFLSNAYQETALVNEVSEKEASIIELRKDNYTKQLAEFSDERSTISTDITNLRNALSSGTQVQYVDKKTGQLVTSTSSSARKTLEAQLSEAVDRRGTVISQIETFNDSIVSLELQLLELEANNSATAELGPLIYLSRLTDVSMDRIINWLLIVIVLVFDPLAVCLVLAANYTVIDNRKTIAKELERGIPGMWDPTKDPADDDYLQPAFFDELPEKDVLDDLPVDSIFEEPTSILEVPTQKLETKEDKIKKEVAPEEKKSYINHNNKQLSPSQKRDMTATQIYEWFQKNKMT